MGCNCGNKGKANAPAGGKSSGKYALTMPDGTRSFYDTESAARAANQKAGGKGLVRRIG